MISYLNPSKNRERNHHKKPKNLNMRKTQLIWLLVGIFAALVTFVNLIGFGNETINTAISDILPIIAGIFAVTFLTSAFNSFGEVDLTKTAWLFILIGMTLNTLAESTYAILELGYGIDVDDNFPSLADFFWCAAYIPLFAALTTMFVSYKNSGFPMGSAKAYVLFISLFVIVTAAVTKYLLLPILDDSETELFVKVFYLFYPIADLLLVLPAVILLYITNLFSQGTISKPLRFLTIGFALIAVADLLYSYLDWQDAYEGAGRLIDIAWNTGYLSIALSAIYQKKLMDSLK
jgi:hypothetical protein